jgi:N-acetyl-alpha-D-glucosaminyl L-malate synthase BshA
MLPPSLQPRVITTLHGTDSMLLGRDPYYAPAIQHALRGSDALTAVSAYLARETRQLLDVEAPIEVIHNFCALPRPRRTRQEMRRELGLRDDQVLVLHSSNLRPVKRIDLILEAAARIRPADRFRLLILAGEPFGPFREQVRRLGLEDRVLVRESVCDVEEYLPAADLGLFASDTESFCLSILELMAFGRPSVATRVVGIPEVIDDTRTGLLTPPGDALALARAVEELMADPARRDAMGQAGRKVAETRFSADAMVPCYEALYRQAWRG